MFSHANERTVRIVLNTSSATSFDFATVACVFSLKYCNEKRGDSGGDGRRRAQTNVVVSAEDFRRDQNHRNDNKRNK